MNRSKVSIFWGVGLLLLGIALLVQNLQLLPGVMDLVWIALFAIGGAAFVGVYLAERERWWALIPGGAFAGIALLMALETFVPQISGAAGGAIFLAVLATSFLAVFALHQANWWAVIPAGVLYTTAIVSLVEQTESGFEAGSIMMLGLAATFAVLSRVQTPQGRISWPLIPAAVLLAIGLILLVQSFTWVVWVVSVLLIVGGGYLVYRNLAGRA